MKRYKIKNGYFKYYNRDGLKCQIKFSKYFDRVKFDPTLVIIRLIDPNNLGETQIHIPEKKFSSIFEIQKFILTSLERDGLIFKVTPYR